MRYKIITYLLATCFFTAPGFTQKAYDMVNYYGKTGKYNIKLELADGYPEASKIIVTISPATKFNFTANELNTDTARNLSFSRFSANGKKQADSILLKQIIGYENLPVIITGYYFMKGTIYNFSLKRK